MVDKMAKKAEEAMWGTILGIVLILVAGVVLLIFLSQTGKISTSVGEKEQCVSSVRSQSLIGMINPTTVVDLRCTTKQMKVDEDDPEKQKALVASEMASCWEQFGEGKVKLFDIETGSYCVVCSRIEFTKPAKLEDFGEYLLKTTAKGKDATYYEYLFNTKGTPQVVDEYRRSPIASQDTLDTSRPLAVMFVAEKNVDKWTGYLITAGGTALAAGAVLVTGGTATPFLVIAAGAGAGAGFTTNMFISPHFYNQNFVAGTVLWPYEDIPALKCSRLEGRAGPLQFVT
jgi:hypothetical protein